MMQELIPGPNDPGRFIEGPNRKYPAQGDIGKQTFEADFAKYHRKREKSLQLISWLITNVKKDIHAKLKAIQGFRNSCASENVLAVWEAI